jgi:hypothetical protein
MQIKRQRCSKLNMPIARANSKRGITHKKEKATDLALPPPWRKSVGKSPPVRFARVCYGAAMLLRHAMNSRLMPCLRLCGRPIAVRYGFGRRRPERGIHHRPILNGIGDFKSTKVPHYRSRRSQGYAGFRDRRARKGQNDRRTCSSADCTRDRCNKKGVMGALPLHMGP